MKLVAQAKGLYVGYIYVIIWLISDLLGCHVLLPFLYWTTVLLNVCDTNWVRYTYLLNKYMLLINYNCSVLSLLQDFVVVLMFKFSSPFRLFVWFGCLNFPPCLDLAPSFPSPTNTKVGFSTSLTERLLWEFRGGGGRGRIWEACGWRIV